MSMTTSTAIGWALIAYGLTTAACCASCWHSSSWIVLLNVFVLQWFGVRLVPRMVTEQVALRPDHVSLGTGGLSIGWQCETREAHRGWKLTGWIWPLTGWWSDYRWIWRHS